MALPSIPDNALFAKLLRELPPRARLHYLRTHPPSLALIEHLKQHSDGYLLSDPAEARQICHCIFFIAMYLRDDSLALPLAAWAWGNFETYHAPKSAMFWYELALQGYRQVDPPQPITVARLLSNLVAPRTDCGRFDLAQAAYDEANPILVEAYQAAKQAHELNGEPAQHAYKNALYRLLALKQNFGWQLYNQRQYEESLRISDQALALAELYSSADVVEVQVNRSLTLIPLGRVEESEMLLLQHRPIAEKYEQHYTVARIDMNLGELYAYLGHPAIALPKLRMARRVFENDNAMELGSVWLREALVFERVGALSKACDMFSHAREHFAAAEMLPQVAVALLQEASVRRRYGDFAIAHELLDELELLWQEPEDRERWSRVIVLERAELALAEAQPDIALVILETQLRGTESPISALHRQLLSAEAWLAQADQSDTASNTASRAAFEYVLDAARGQKIMWLVRRALLGLGRLLRANAPEVARTYLESAAELDAAVRRTLTLEELKASFTAQTSDALEILVRLSIDQGNVLQAQRYMWQAKGGALLDLLRRTQGDSVDVVSERLSDLRRRFASHRWQATQTAEQSQFVSDIEQARLAQDILDLRLDLNQLFDGVGDDLRRLPEQILTRMDADVLIEYMVCEDDLVAIRVDRQGTAKSTILGSIQPIRSTIQRLLFLFESTLARWHQVREQAHDSKQQLNEARRMLKLCYDLVLAPLGPFPEGGHLLIAPCPTLYHLPFAALWDGQHYVVEQYQVEFIPSSALLALEQSEQVSGPPLVIADSANGQLTSFPEQVDIVASKFSETVRFRDEPGAVDYLDHLRVGPRVLHIAAHTRFDDKDTMTEDLPLFWSLQLPHALLTVEHTYNLSLAGTELVVLIGCETSHGLDTGGSLLSFPAAFFGAGARRVLTTLWKVHHTGATDFVTRFYEEFAQGNDPVYAVQQAQRAMINDPFVNHPVLWAAFVCLRH